MFATSHINHLHMELKKMLINEKGQQVHVPTGKDLSDNAKRMLREVHAPLPYKNHPFFRLENRVRMAS